MNGEYNLSFAVEDKPPLTKNPYNTVKRTSSSSYGVIKINLFHNFKRLTIKFYAWTIIC